MELFISPAPYTLQNVLFLIDGGGHAPGDVHRYFTVENGEIIGHNLVYTPGETMEYKPFLKVDERVLRSMLQAFQQAALKRGMEIDSESKVRGKLEATERHLSDMRTLLKLK